MNSRKNKNILGGVGILSGSIVLLLVIDFLSKPDTIPLSLNLIESMRTYFFSFVFSMGNIGWVLGGLLLIGYLTLCYYFGVWIQKTFFN